MHHGWQHILGDLAVEIFLCSAAASYKTVLRVTVGLTGAFLLSGSFTDGNVSSDSTSEFCIDFGFHCAFNILECFWWNFFFGCSFVFSRFIIAADFTTQFACPKHIVSGNHQYWSPWCRHSHCKTSAYGSKILTKARCWVIFVVITPIWSHVNRRVYNSVPFSFGLLHWGAHLTHPSLLLWPYVNHHQTFFCLCRDTIVARNSE